MISELTLQLIQAWLQGAPLPHLTSDVIKLMTLHQLGGLLSHIAPPMSASDAEICAQAWQKNALLHLKRLRILQKVWPNQAPEPMIFKGADYCEQLYRDPGIRACCDLDFLVPGDFDALARHLEKFATEIRQPQQMRFPGAPFDSLGFVIDGCLLELHRQIVPLPPHALRAEELWSRSQKHRVFEELCVRCPTPHDRLAIWLAHAAKDAFDLQLMKYIDFITILKQQTDDFTPMLERTHLSAPYLLALKRLQMLNLSSSSYPTPKRSVREQLQVQLAQKLLPQPWDSLQMQPTGIKRDFIKALLWHPKDFLPKAAAALWHRCVPNPRSTAKTPAQK